MPRLSSYNNKRNTSAIEKYVSLVSSLPPSVSPNAAVDIFPLHQPPFKPPILRHSFAQLPACPPARSIHPHPTNADAQARSGASNDLSTPPHLPLPQCHDTSLSARVSSGLVMSYVLTRPSFPLHSLSTKRRHSLVPFYRVLNKYCTVQ